MTTTSSNQGASAAVRFERVVPAVAEWVPRVRRELQEWATQLQLDDEHVHAVCLCVSEAMANAVTHAFLDRPPGTIDVVGEASAGRLEVRVVDNGRGMGPRHDSPGLGMGLPLMGRLCARVDLAPGPDGTGTEVRMLFEVPGLAAASAPESARGKDILARLDDMRGSAGLTGGDIVGIVDLLVPDLVDLCSVTLLEADGSARRVGARVAAPDGSIDAAASAWTMAFPVSANASPSRQAAATGHTQVTRIDEDWARSVSPDEQRAQELLALGLKWWAAVPLRSAGRAVGSISVAWRSGAPNPVVGLVEEVAERAGPLVATAGLVDELRLARDRLQGILGALSEAVTVEAADGTIVYSNAAAEALGHRPAPGLSTQADAQGATRWLQTTTKALGDLRLTVTQDLTAEKEAQRELAGSLSRLRLLADAGFGGVIRGIDDRIVEANATFLQMLGYDDVSELPPWPLMTPAEWAHVDAAAVAAMRETGRSDLYEKEYLRRDGSRVRVLLGAVVADPEVFEWLCVVVDISERRAFDPREQTGLASIALPTPERTEARDVADVINGLAAAVLIQRPGQGIVYANQAAAEAMGMASPRAVVEATPEEIAEGWVTYDEQGAVLTAERYPSRRILDGERDVPPLVVRTIHRDSGREYWRQVRARAVLDDAGELLMVVSMTEDITEGRRAVLTQRLLAEAGRVLASSLDYEQTLQELVELTVPELADWCTVLMPDDQDVLQAVAVAHSHPDKVAAVRAFNAQHSPPLGAVAAVQGILRGGPSVLLAEVSDALIDSYVEEPERRAALHQLGMRSVIQTPIAAVRGPVIGVLNLVNAESQRVFTEADLALAEELARRAGTAVQNARLHAERSAIAETLQESLLPGALPDVPGYELAYVYEPAGEENWVGGDFLDVFPVGDAWLLIVGDVAGHGAEAAALTAQARHTLRAICEATGDPVAAVAHLNRLLMGEKDPSLATVCAAAIREDGDGAVATIVCAGHPLPYLTRDGAVRAVGRPGPLLGGWDAQYAATEVRLRDGDLLTMYTDGVPETRGEDERFGDARLVDVLARATGAQDAVARVQTTLSAFRDGRQTDDTAVLAIRRVTAASSRRGG